MAGFTDILGSMLEQGMAPSSGTRVGNAFGARSGGSLDDILGSLGQVLGSSAPGSAPPTREVPSRQSVPVPDTGAGGLGNVLGDVLGSLGQNKAILGGLGALVTAVLTRGGRKTGHAKVGSGGLAMLASLALSALMKMGQAPTATPRALVEAQTPEDEQALEKEAEIIVRAMINAAKADGRMDETEMQKILGNLEQGGLTEEEKEFFLREAEKPMDIDAVIASAGNRPELAAQIYAASLLAIEVDTPAEQRYLEKLAAGLGLDSRVTDHLEQTLGVGNG